MPKHPVPKKKTSKARSKRRYSAFQQRAQKQLIDLVHIVKCDDCGAAKLVHHVCKECGKHKGRQVIDLQKKIDKITTVKA
ncbi:50S ribosomal protein L32 [Patescibacteria group bacterium]|nr:50S ribosomal protein L32 [Patescibacteria group bacterium]